jgi:SGF29 tudor-like domain
MPPLAQFLLTLLGSVFDLPESQVVVLSPLLERLSKGDSVYAVYPDTTSFYPATVAQATNRKSPVVLVHFVDDADEFGITHDKAVPLQHVMLPPSSV